MRITFLGTGTSQGVPVIACDCNVCLSDDRKDKRLRTSILIEYDDSVVVVDTGPDFRYQMLRAGVQRLDAVLLTHSHKDHIAGLDDVRAFNYKQQVNMPIYTAEDTIQAVKREFYYAFEGSKYPGVPRLELHEIEAGREFEVCGKTFMPIQVMHHKMPVLGFRIDDFTYITDAKTIDEKAIKLIEGTEVLVVNCLQESPHISHFTLAEALDFIAMIKPKKAFLTHISHRFGTNEYIQNKLPKGVKVAYDGLQIELK